MKIFNYSMKILALALLVSVSACKEKYPDLGEGLFAEIVTNKGIMVVKLTHDKTPVTVANFVALAEGNHPMVAEQYKGKSYYDSLIFHRVMDKFMIQGGDPTATGSGSPGYRFGDEFDETLKHDKPGILSMANYGPGGTNGSQFFITEVPIPHLDNVHTVFGEVVLGLDIQDSISNVKTGIRNKPEKDVIIEQVNIIRQGFEASNFDAVKVWETELPKLEEKQKQREEEARKKADEAKKIADEKVAEAAKAILPALNDYKSKVTTSSSGLMSYTISKGSGARPKQGQTVQLYYEGYFTDGILFDSNRKEVEESYGKYNPKKEEEGMYNPMPMQISPDVAMIAGFKEGVANMRVGDRTYLYLPSHLAYGEAGRGAIQPNTDLIFIIELVAIAN